MVCKSVPSIATEIKTLSRCCKKIWNGEMFFRHLRSLSSRKSACVSGFGLVKKISPLGVAKATSRCSHYLPAAILEDQGGPPTWRLHT